MASPETELLVRIERGRSGFRVVARTPEATTKVVVTFSGGADGVWFRLEQPGHARVFSREVVERDRPLSAIVRLIGDEVDLAKVPSQKLLGLLFHSLLVYVQRIGQSVPLPRWGRPLRDRRVERALELLDADLSKLWTVERLARAVGLSRPAFARQFVRVLGLSPMRYLADRRLRYAADLLSTSDASLAEIAARVGYRSEFAFGRAFKRFHKVAPGTYRRQQSVAQSVILARAA